jgi:hypothetical protein
MNIYYFTGLTGLEPATSAVTGRCSNQLNYSPKAVSNLYCADEWCFCQTIGELREIIFETDFRQTL